MTTFPELAAAARDMWSAGGSGRQAAAFKNITGFDLKHLRVARVS